MIKLYKEKKNFKKCPFKLLKDNNNEMFALFLWLKGLKMHCYGGHFKHIKYYNGFLQLSDNSSSYRFNSL